MSFSVFVVLSPRACVDEQKLDFSLFYRGFYARLPFKCATLFMLARTVRQFETYPINISRRLTSRQFNGFGRKMPLISAFCWCKLHRRSSCIMCGENATATLSRRRASTQAIPRTPSSKHVARTQTDGRKTFDSAGPHEISIPLTTTQFSHGPRLEVPHYSRPLPLRSPQ